MFKKLLIGSATLAFIAVPAAVFGQDNGGTLAYTPLEPLPIYSGQDLTITNLMPAIFRTVIMLTVVLAVGAIMWGGFLYITSDSYSGKSDGRRWIQESVTGLILAIVAWLVLYTINPRLIGFDLSSIEPTATSTPGGSGPTEPGELTHAEAVSQFASNGIGVDSTSNCSDQTRTDCTSLEGMRQRTIDGIVSLKNACIEYGLNCSELVVTGGTEAGHTPGGHDSGRKVDIRISNDSGIALTLYLAQQAGQDVTSGSARNVQIGDYGYTVLYEGDHWDIRVN